MSGEEAGTNDCRVVADEGVLVSTRRAVRKARIQSLGVDFRLLKWESYNFFFFEVIDNLPAPAYK